VAAAGLLPQVDRVLIGRGGFGVVATINFIGLAAMMPVMCSMY
jgi:hypothetical protein